MNRINTNYNEKIYSYLTNKSSNLDNDKKIRYNKIRKLISNIKNRKILDMGCETGELISSFVPNNECWRLDIADNSLIIAEKKE